MEEVKNLVGRAQLSKALDRLLEIAPDNFKNEITVLKARFSKLERDERMGILGHSNASVERNQISIAILNLSNIEKDKVSLSNVTSDKDHKTSKGETKTNKIFFSYAWGDRNEKGESRENIVNKLYDSLKKDGFNVIRDKSNLNYGDLITKFMEKLGEGDLILVFISEKYFKSPFCMFELLEIGRNNKWDKQLFSNRILPIPEEFINFAKPSVLEIYFEYWAEEEKEWSDFVKKRTGQIKPAQFERYNKTRSIHQNLGDLLDWIVDINQSTTDLLSENDFEKIKQTILDRLKD